MLKSYSHVSRFMDGISLNFGADFLYLNDISGAERIGASHLHTQGEKPELHIADINSKKTLVFEGDYFRFCELKFSWFPSIQEAGILYDGCDNVTDRQVMMQFKGYENFVFGELFFEIARLNGLPLGEEAQHKLMRDLDFPASLYAYSLELLYANINGNRDVLMHVRSLGSTESHTPVIGAQGVNLVESLDGFLESNPELKAHLIDGRVSGYGIRYDTPEKIIDKIKKFIPEQILEAGYQRFKSEIEARKRLDALRRQYPFEALTEQVKEVGAEYRIFLGTVPDDIKAIASL